MAGTGSDELLRARRKMLAYERTKMRLKQQLERIDYELDVIKPMLMELERSVAMGELPDYKVDD